MLKSYYKKYQYIFFITKEYWFSTIIIVVLIKVNKNFTISLVKVKTRKNYLQKTNAFLKKYSIVIITLKTFTSDNAYKVDF